jgi:hypothetical protein
MDLINKQVLHKNFGKGNIVDCNAAYVVVQFKSGIKEFVYPDAFEKYLTLVDKKAANSVDKILEKLEIEREIEEQKIEEQKAIELEEHQRQLRIEKLKKYKIHSSSQVAFNCKEEELDTVFAGWRIFTGTIKSGVNKGKINKLIRVQQNSACLITSKEIGAHEKDRYIAGFFMVDEGFAGRLCEDGYIPAHKDYRIKLTEDISKKMPFWKYYVNERYPDNMTWSGRYRYFDNAVMAQILKDIVLLNSEQQDRSQEFFDYFCLINQIEEQDIAEPSGPLMRLKKK